MTDIVSPEKRSQMMSGIRSKNTKPELIIRSWLHRHGYRYRLHRKDLPGKPDIVLPGRRCAIFVHGCFFHHHEGCRLAYVPKTRTEWWQEKFTRNVERDTLAIQELENDGWRVLVVWECQVRSGSFEDILKDFLSLPAEP
jgi:DNA mismatch endonuclease (patch repair protein)